MQRVRPKTIEWFYNVVSVHHARGRPILGQPEMKLRAAVSGNGGVYGPVIVEGLTVMKPY